MFLFCFQLLAFDMQNNVIVIPFIHYILTINLQVPEIIISWEDMILGFLFFLFMFAFDIVDVQG